MSANLDLLRSIPKVDTLLLEQSLVDHSGAQLTEAVRTVLDCVRSDIQNGVISAIPSTEQLVASVLAKLEEESTASLRAVYNAAGVVLHTNLGRASLSQRALKHVNEIAGGYSTLEYDLESGARGSRHSHVEQLLCKITGAQAAMAVNNNAAAVMLILAALARGREVVLSRGELVEIGGSFRVPDVMSESGATLREVGTTNKTHLKDYKNAINDQTGMLLKVHTSNYRIIGFTQSVDLPELVQLGREHGVPVVEDLGSGALFPLSRLGIYGEPSPQDSIAAGVDLVCFSGDKLLGGPQAGIIVGSAELVARVKAHPLARAMRIDKLSLAALEGTLMSYLDERKVCSEIPTLSMLSATEKQLKERAEQLAQLISGQGVAVEVMPDEGRVGGGAMPEHPISSYAVAVMPQGISAQQLELALRSGQKPIIARIAKDKLLLNVLTLSQTDIPEVAKLVKTALEGQA